MVVHLKLLLDVQRLTKLTHWKVRAGAGGWGERKPSCSFWLQKPDAGVTGGPLLYGQNRASAIMVSGVLEDSLELSPLIWAFQLHDFDLGQVT